jgi:hypothetical protein
MNAQRWILVIPPLGAARSVAQHIANAFLYHLSPSQFKVIDSATYLTGYANLLKTADDTMTTDLFNQSFAVACLDFQPTYCLVAALAPVTLFTLQLLKKYGVRTVHWFFEDYSRAVYWESVVAGYDHFFAIQHGPVETVCAASGTAFHFLPTACGCADLPLHTTPRPYDTVFIGVPSAYRVAILEALARYGINLAIAGSGWQAYHGILEPMIVSTSWINEEASFTLMQQSRTGINLSFDNPSGRSDVHVSPRVFDLLAAGCLVASEEVPLLKETVPGVSVATFGTIEEAVAVVAGLLETYSPDDEHILKNRNLVLDKHRYRNRVETIIRTTERISGFEASV